MTRVPLTAAMPDDPRLRTVFESFERERRDPIALYLAVAHAPDILTGFDAIGQAIRHASGTPRGLRELLILRVSQLARSRYEWAHHVGMALAAGVTQEQVAELEEWRSSELFSDEERAALDAADQIHVSSLSRAAFDRLAEHFSHAQLVELVVTIAHYESVARVLQALDVEIEPEYASFLP